MAILDFYRKHQKSRWCSPTERPALRQSRSAKRRASISSAPSSGSEGTLGIVTEATVRLTAIPAAVETLLVIFDDVVAACRAVGRVIRSGVVPAALEIVDRRTIEAVEASVYAAGLPVTAGAVLIVELDGLPVNLAGEIEAIRSACEAERCQAIEIARDEAERKRFWRARKGAFGAMGRLAPDLYVHDAVVPRIHLPGVLEQVCEICDRHGLKLANVFHAGDGNLHPNICFDRRNPDELARVMAAGKEILEACVAVGGVITGEHGVGVEKRDYMHLVFGAADLEAMMRAARHLQSRRRLQSRQDHPDDAILCRVESEGPGLRRGAPRMSHRAPGRLDRAPRRTLERIEVPGASVERSTGRRGSPSSRRCSPTNTPSPRASSSAAVGPGSRFANRARPLVGGDLPRRALGNRRLRARRGRRPRACGNADPRAAGRRSRRRAGSCRSIRRAARRRSGGAIASASMGPRSHAFGRVADAVLGLELVGADGNGLEMRRPRRQERDGLRPGASSTPAPSDRSRS